MHQIGLLQHREVRVGLETSNGLLSSPALIAPTQELQHPSAGGIGQRLEHPAHYTIVG